AGGVSARARGRVRALTATKSFNQRRIGQKIDFKDSDANSKTEDRSRVGNNNHGQSVSVHSFVWVDLIVPRERS
ncbi:MAG TPA: hypothetical protein VIM69_11360, partial [Opitutaceae bacterium]